MPAHDPRLPGADCHVRIAFRSGFLFEQLAPLAAALGDLDRTASEQRFARELTQLLLDKFPTTTSQMAWRDAAGGEGPGDDFRFDAEGRDEHVCRDVRDKLPDLIGDIRKRPDTWLVFSGR